MDMNMGIILENLEEDFQRTIQEVKRVEGIKEAKIKSLIDLFELTLNQISLEDNPLVKT